VSPDELEAHIQERGRKLLANVETERLITLSPAWWQERLMAWATSDPEFRTKLLRFVDVLPSLRTPAAVADHVRQYFRSGTPPQVRFGAATAGTGAFRPVLSRVVRRGVFTMADRFIGGATPMEALKSLGELVQSGTGYTVDLLGEAVLSEAEADSYAKRYQELLAALADIPATEHSVTRPNVSLKLSSLTSHFERAAPVRTSLAVQERLLPLLRLAREQGVFVNVDMEQYRFKDLTHRIFQDVALSAEFKGWDRLGIVVQAYLKDAPSDIERLRALADQRGTPLTVRLVKGAYWDEETVLAEQENRESPVFEDKAETDANFERCTDDLLAAHPLLRPAFGSHNPRSIVQAMVKAEAAGLPAEDIEFQMLFGMAEGLRRAVRDAGYRTRVYVPVGAILPGMAYLVRRLLENTSNESWLVHRHEEGDPDEVLAAPHRSDTGPKRGRREFVNQTPAEFYYEETRTEMARALERVRHAFGGRYAGLIGSDSIETMTWDDVRPPAEPSLVMGMVPRCGPEEVDRAVVAARRAFPAWRDLPASQRATPLRKAADLLAARRLEFAATMVFECAKPWYEAEGDVNEAIDYLRYYAQQAERLAVPQDLGTAGEDDQYFYEARGVAGIIAPWNFPLAIITGGGTCGRMLGNREAG
jgi:RHH-type proline utilization regulon transcriptional repressor/proline dehydrogenase/delta 1-pyrroline-5-carboxylate dehydrogenase